MRTGALLFLVTLFAVVPVRAAEPMWECEMYEVELESFECATLDAGAMLYSLEGIREVTAYAETTSTLTELVLTFQQRTRAFLDRVDDREWVRQFQRRMIRLLKRHNETTERLFERLASRTIGIRAGNEQNILGFQLKHRR